MAVKILCARCAVQDTPWAEVIGQGPLLRTLAHDFYSWEGAKLLL